MRVLLMDEARFLLAQLHMDSLRDKTSAKSIKKALEILPKGSNALDLAYDGAMQRIENQREGFRLLATQLLGWLTYSERLMTVEEVRHAMAIEPGTPDLDDDNLSDVDEILGFCAGLVIMDEETPIIRLVHYTTQEYFKRNGERLLATAQEDIAKSCLTYLLYERFGDGWVNEVDSAEDENDQIMFNEGRGWKSSRAVKYRLQEYPFLDYAARYCAAHARVCGQQSVKDLMMSFAKDHRKVSSAGQVMLVLDSRDKLVGFIDRTMSRSPLSALHVLAYVGHRDWILELLNHGFKADAKDSTRQTPLWWAALAGHYSVVELLLSQSHVNVNNRGLCYNRARGLFNAATPLGIAAEFGEEKIVDLLIEHEDVNVNLPTDYGHSPLLIAARKGHKKVVQSLLTRNDIDVNTKDYYGLTPLSGAAYSGHEDIVKQLLERKNIQVNSLDNRGHSPLALAAYQGHEGVVRILLGCADIDVNTRDVSGDVPMLNAVYLSNKAVAKSILSHTEVDVIREGMNGEISLHHAAVRGYASKIRLLVSRTGLAVNWNKFYETVVHKAAEWGDASVVELILACGEFDANPKDKDGCAPLHLAAERGREASVMILLGQAGVQVDLKDCKGKTPLAQAMIARSTAVVKLLCAHPDVDLNPTDNEGRDLFALVRDQQEWAAARAGEARAKITLELEQCLDILRTAIEAGSRGRSAESRVELS